MFGHQRISHKVRIVLYLLSFRRNMPPECFSFLFVPKSTNLLQRVEVQSEHTLDAFSVPMHMNYS